MRTRTACWVLAMLPALVGVVACDARPRPAPPEPGLTLFTRRLTPVNDRPAGGAVVTTLPAGRSVRALCYVRSARDAYKTLTVRVEGSADGWVSMLANHDAFTVGPSEIRSAIAVCTR
ncbi:MAG: hypothetical protein HOQ22_08340 [Nocardioidaceae bacterium]|nr:hypothetical protein [Nocardioidaceae bacterium]NUS51029.1 hypothetical protein [Nocardioidaceae bacterium]